MSTTAKFKKVLARNLARLRAKKKITQQALSDLSGISRVEIARIETGRLNPGTATTAALAKALGVTLDALVF